MRTTIVNVGTIVSGDWRQPLTDGDSVSMIDGRIDSVGVVSERSVRDSDVVIDADGATACACLKTVCRRFPIRPVTDVLQGLVQMRLEPQSTDPKTVRFSMDFTSAGRSKGSGAFSPGVLGRPIAEKKSFSPPGVRTKQNRSGILPWFVN